MNAEPIQKSSVLGMGLILALGIFLRLYPSTAGEHVIGVDEKLYVKYVNMLSQQGLGAYPQITRGYIDAQTELPQPILPPTRVLYIGAGSLWHLAFGTEPRTALHHVSSAFSILTLLLSAAFAARLGGPAAALGVAALMACAPTQIHMAQHALIDGVFSFWALLSLAALWENLRVPNDAARLALLGASLCGLVLTKENAAFAYAPLLVIVAANRRLGFGKVTWPLLIVLVTGPALGVGILLFLTGGPTQFLHLYALFVQKNNGFFYVIRYGDGPWSRYLVDLLLVSPLILLLAIGEIFQLNTGKKAALYLVAFLGVSYACLCNIKYGMNLRFANMWDMPLRFLAFSQLAAVSTAFRRCQRSALVVLTTAVCLFELNQFRILFIQHGLYELLTDGLLRATNILK